MPEGAPSSSAGSAAAPAASVTLRVERPPPGPAQGSWAVPPGVILAAGAALCLAVLAWYWLRRGRGARA